MSSIDSKVSSDITYSKFGCDCDSCKKRKNVVTPNPIPYNPRIITSNEMTLEEETSYNAPCQYGGTMTVTKKKTVTKYPDHDCFREYENGMLVHELKIYKPNKDANGCIV